ncbi:MAG: hypothetical protein V4541_03725 [Bacteroidota bacterium]
MLLDITICVILFIVGFNLKYYFKNFTRSERKILNGLFFLHLSFGIAFITFNLSGFGGDAIGYWQYPRIYGWDYIINAISQKSPSAYVFFINYFLTNILSLSFITVSMFYIILGYFGFVVLLQIIKENIPNYHILKKVKLLGLPIFPYVLYFPNIHFWTSGIGKDTLLFFSIVIFIYGIKNIRKRFLYIIISATISIFIRPHILLFLCLAFALATILHGRIKAYQKALLFILFAAVLVVLIPRVMEFTKIENFQTQAFEDFSNDKAQKLNSRSADSGIDISNYSYPFKVFTFLFRPLFVDMGGFLAIIASIENLVFIFFFVYVLRSKPMEAFREGNIVIKSLLLFFIIGSLVFPLTLGNLGIILRQKAPFIIVFIVFGLWVITKKHERIMARTI